MADRMHPQLGDLDEGEPTGDLIVVPIVIPAPVYKALSPIADHLGTTTRRMILQGVIDFIDRIERARRKVEANAQREE